MDYKHLIGKTVRLNQVNNFGSYNDSRYNGTTGKVLFVDDRNQIHLENCGIAMIPETDDWEVIEGE